MYKKPIIAFFAMLLIQAIVSVAVLIPVAIYEFMQMAADDNSPIRMFSLRGSLQAHRFSR